MKFIRTSLFPLAAVLLTLSLTEAAPRPPVEFPLHDPCNLFKEGEPVRLEVKLNPATLAQSEIEASVFDYWGRKVWQGKGVPGGGALVAFEPGKLDPGYYELRFELPDTGGKPAGPAMASFGVVRFLDRTAAEVKSGNYRFGLKMGGWPKDVDWMKAVTASARLGLHWTRNKFTDVTPELASMPLNIVCKVEGLPEDAYDEKRYGPKDQFKMRHFGWQKATVPLEEPYKKWLKEKVAALPKEQNTFEIMNEPWGKIPPEDLAKVAQWSKDAILEVRPDAHVGPNLGTHFAYDAKVIAAGGMKGMDSLFLHPYGHPERNGLRARVRGIRDFYAERMGGPVDLYATEYGSPTPPEGERSYVTETMQAAWNVRRSLTFYAEGLKGFMPHLMAQDEKDPAEKEDWYGHFRKTLQPKPALIALANAARLIDGSRYVGDLFLKPDVGARLFERDGKFLLALWTNDLDIPLDLNVGANQVTMTDLVGKETVLDAPGGKLHLNLTGNTIYLSGVSADLAKQASTQPRNDQWVEGVTVRKSRDARLMRKPPAIDGKISSQEWSGQTKIQMARSKVPPQDASGEGYVAWDKNYLYVAAEVKDDHPDVTVDSETAEKKDWRYDSHNPTSARMMDGLELFVGSQPMYQVPEFVFTYDMRLFFSPILENGKPIACVVNDREKTFDPIPGLKIAYAKTGSGWSVEMAVPLSQFKDFPNKAGGQVAFEMRIDDADSGEGVRLINPVDANPGFWEDATLWSYLNLVE